MIDSCSFDSQRWRPDSNPANVGCSNFRYANNDRNIYSTETHQQKNWTEKPTEIHFKFILRAILHKYTRFIASQRLADEAEMISNKVCYSDFEILEKSRRINLESMSNIPRNRKCLKARTLDPNWKTKCWKPKNQHLKINAHIRTK